MCQCNGHCRFHTTDTPEGVTMWRGGFGRRPLAGRGHNVEMTRITPEGVTMWRGDFGRRPLGETHR
jgi:hypothetical protein